MNNLSVGSKIKELRTKVGMNQSIIAESLQVLNKALYQKLKKAKEKQVQMF